VPDIRELIGQVAARNNIRVDEDDPIFAVETINRLMLEEAVEELVKRISGTIIEFEASARAVETHAGKLFADEVRQSAVAWRIQLADDIKAAGLKSAELVKKVSVAHSRPSMIRWATSGLLGGLVLFGCGVLVGMHLR
jgi:hypothetical protein